MPPGSDLTRRSFLGAAGLALGGFAGQVALGSPRRLLARAFPAADDDAPGEAVRKVLTRLFGARPIRKGHVDLVMPENAPDGRTVPVFIESDLPMEAGDYVQALHLLVDKNPDIHLAEFRFTPMAGKASVDTRIKMRATSWVRAVAETSRGELWYASFKVFPASNGCG
jgi:sulfur-oxidizing protein SoxY